MPLLRIQSKRSHAISRLISLAISQIGSVYRRARGHFRARACTEEFARVGDIAGMMLHDEEGRRGGEEEGVV